MLRQAAVPIALLVAGIVVLIAGGDAVAAQATAFALIGVACVVAVSLTFLAIGRAEDAEREEAARRREPPQAPDPHHERPAAERRRPLPPRRPS